MTFKHEFPVLPAAKPGDRMIRPMIVAKQLLDPSSSSSSAPSIHHSSTNAEFTTHQLLQQQLKANFFKELEKFNKTGQQSLLDVIASTLPAAFVAPAKAPGTINGATASTEVTVLPTNQIMLATTSPLAVPVSATNLVKVISANNVDPQLLTNVLIKKEILPILHHQQQQISLNSQQMGSESLMAPAQSLMLPDAEAVEESSASLQKPSVDHHSSLSSYPENSDPLNLSIKSDLFARMETEETLDLSMKSKEVESLILGNAIPPVDDFQTEPIDFSKKTLDMQNSVNLGLQQLLLVVQQTNPLGGRVGGFLSPVSTNSMDCGLSMTLSQSLTVAKEEIVCSTDCESKVNSSSVGCCEQSEEIKMNSLPPTSPDATLSQSQPMNDGSSDMIGQSEESTEISACAM